MFPESVSGYLRINRPDNPVYAPLYWWIGDKLDKDRLLWQLDKLKVKGITGVQVNYPCSAGLGLRNRIKEEPLGWCVLEGKWVVVEVFGTYIQLKPMNPLTGQSIVDKYLKPFEEQNSGESGKALNYFFQDEERIRGDEKYPWNRFFVDEFMIRKSSDCLSTGTYIGDIKPKIRLDYHDVKSELIGDDLPDFY